MTEKELKQDLADLGLSPGASLDEVKAAFRQAAFRSHPDQGGDSESFIRAFAAYRRVYEHLVGAGMGATHSPDSATEPPSGPIDELAQRLAALDAAFAEIRSGMLQAEENWIRDIRVEVAKEINEAWLCTQVDATMSGAIDWVRRKFAEEVRGILSQCLESIASDFNSWMLSWLTPYYERIRRAHARRWYRDRPAQVLAPLGAICGAVVPMGAWGPPLALRCAAGACVGLLLAWPVQRLVGLAKYRAAAMVPTVGSPRVPADGSHMQRVTSEAAGEQIAVRSGVLGANVFGPWGGLAGLVVGAVAGVAFGQPVADRKRIALVELDRFLPNACHQINVILLEHLDRIAAEMREQATTNYRIARDRAVTCLYLLPRTKGQSDGRTRG